MRGELILGLGMAVLAMGCEEASEPASSWSPSLVVPAEPAVPPEGLRPAAAREGSSVARFGSHLVIADEDTSALRIAELPLRHLDGELAHREVALPGPPAQVLALSDRFLVTVRDPGLLLAFGWEDGELVELGRIELARDAWGIGVSPDGATALVTSAWTRVVSVIDLARMQLRQELGVRREPRGVVVLPDGESAYVTHLTGSALTKVEGLTSEPSARRVAFPAAPARLIDDDYREQRMDAASLAYAAVLSGDGQRLLVPRRALGAGGLRPWAGTATVDALWVADDQPVVTTASAALQSRLDVPLERRDAEVRGQGPIHDDGMASPRHVIYRRATNTLLVVSESHDRLVELEAASVDPAARPLHSYRLGRRGSRDLAPSTCGAPSGVVLSEDESRAFVLCRGARAIAEVRLETSPSWVDEPKAGEPKDVATFSLGHEPLSELAARGRQLFFDGELSALSADMACSGCHPDGRDDGHVWQDAHGLFRAFPQHLPSMAGASLPGEPRQTPMLAGRVDPEGPYGWRGESPTLARRILRGAAAHRWWDGGGWGFEGELLDAADALAAYLREGLHAPSEDPRPLTPEERRGQALFADATTGCASCHLPDGGEYTDRRVVELDLRGGLPGHEDRETPRYRTPSLRFVAGTAPYLHDGSAADLRALVDSNHDRMGLTSVLDEEEKQALLAFLERLGGPLAEDGTSPVAFAPEPAETRPLPARPSPEDWTRAPALALERPHPRCQAKRLDGWVQLRCRKFVSEIAQIVGDGRGVTLAHSERYVRTERDRWEVIYGQFEEVDDAIVTFPIAPGDARLFHLVHGTAQRWGGASLDTRMVISELWRPGEAGPTIVVH